MAIEKCVNVHDVSFYKPPVSAINSMCLEKTTHQLAVARSDNSIELWDVKHYPFLQRFFPCIPGTSVEDIKWCARRLFTCGFQGTVIEHDLCNAGVKSTTTITGGVSWCLDYTSRRNLVAVGTEDGFINILELTETGLDHVKLLDKQQGRVLCISWDGTGDHLVTGSVDVIRVWSYKTGHALHKLTTGRSHTNRETIVWTLAVTKDFTIISGDSRGFITFWDGKIGAQIDTLRSHDADILTLCLKDDETSFLCAGVDPVLAVYGRVLHCAGKRQWARGGLYRLHDHDVRAIVADGRVFSGGVSGTLAVSSLDTSPKIRLMLPPLLPGPACVAGKDGQFLLRYLDRVELWKTGSAMPDASAINTPLLLKEKPRCLIKLDCPSSEIILTAAVSKDFIAVSTDKFLRFYLFNLGDLSVSKIGTAEFGQVKLLEFVEDRCWCVTQGNTLYEVTLSENGVEEGYKLHPSDCSNVTDPITHLLASKDGSRLVLADSCSHIAVWSTSSWTVLAQLPNYDAVPTALSFSTESNSIIVAYSDLKVMEFDLKAKKYTEFCRSLDGKLHSVVKGIIADGKRGYIFYDVTNLCSVSAPKPKEHVSPKIPKKDLTDDLKRSLKVTRKFQYIAHASWVNDDDLLVVEATPISLIESLPPVFAKKKFGT